MICNFKKQLHAFLIFLFFGIWASKVKAQSPAGENDFSRSVILTDIARPWDISFSPDGQLWLTEARTYKVFSINNYGWTENDTVTTRSLLADLSVRLFFPANQNPWPEGGLTGLAFHPQFPTKPFVFVVYLYRFDGCLANNAGCFYRKRIERLEYDTLTQQLIVPETPVEVAELPGSNDHNGGRLTIGIDNKLYFCQGDMGAGQYRNTNRKHQAQDTLVPEGKILRFNIEPDSTTNKESAWIPDDNPYLSSSPNMHPSAIYSIGHRNPQGIVSARAGNSNLLFSSEHGPQSDDELNLLIPRGNYGYPFVTGMADGNYNNISNGPFTPGPLNGLPTEQSYNLLLQGIQPISTLGSTAVNPIPGYSENAALRPTVSPAGIDFYSSYAHTNIPGWGNSLLIATLKNTNRNPSIMRVKLNSSATAVEGLFEYWRENLRYRDIAISPDGKDIFIITDEANAKLIRYRFSGMADTLHSANYMAYRSAGNVNQSSANGWEVNFTGSLWQPATNPPGSGNPITIHNGHTWLINKNLTQLPKVPWTILPGGVLEIAPGIELVVHDDAFIKK